MQKTTVITGIIIALLFGYFGYKGFNLYYYNNYELANRNYSEFLSRFSVTDAFVIKQGDVLVNDYLEFQNIRIKNDFKDFERFMDSAQDSLRLVLRDENEEVKASFWISVADTYVHRLKSDKTLFNSEDKRMTNEILTDFLENNNINNDIELFDYLSKLQKRDNNIFNSVKKMKENYAIQFIISQMPNLDNITLISGDYNGYILNLKGNIKEASILKDDKRYVFTFIDNSAYYTSEYIKDILNTIIIR